MVLIGHLEVVVAPVATGRNCISMTTTFVSPQPTTLDRRVGADRRSADRRASGMAIAEAGRILALSAALADAPDELGATYIARLDRILPLA